jgi:hypothetical protein
MTNTEVRAAMQPIIDQMEADSDPHFFVHFSREEDHYAGSHSGLDGGDALIIIARLAKQFDLDPEAMALSASSDVFALEVTPELREAASLLSRLQSLRKLKAAADKVCALNVDLGVGFGARPGTDEMFQDALVDLYNALCTVNGKPTTDEMIADLMACDTDDEGVQHG